MFVATIDGYFEFNEVGDEFMENDKEADGKRYLMITTDRGLPFTTYAKYKSEEEMSEAQMYIWRNGYGAKELTKPEYKRALRRTKISTFWKNVLKSVRSII